MGERRDLVLEIWRLSGGLGCSNMALMDALRNRKLSVSVSVEARLGVATISIQYLLN